MAAAGLGNAARRSSSARRRRTRRRMISPSPSIRTRRGCRPATSCVLKDALSYTLRTWRDWQGGDGRAGAWRSTRRCSPSSTTARATFAGADSAGHGRFSAAFSAKAAESAVARRVLPRFPPRSSCFCRISWRACTGSTAHWFYMGAQAVALMTLALGDSLSERARFAGRGRSRICALLGSALRAGDG